jgi:uncharacterized membrane protein YgcG
MMAIGRIAFGVIFVLAFASFLYAQEVLPGRTALEFDGVVQSISETAISINGQVIDISGAQVEAPLAVGSVVRVRAVQVAGSLRAEHLSFVPVGMPPGIVEFWGGIEAIDATTLILGGQSFDLAEADTDDELSIGETVRVLARATAPGVWQALEVDRADDVPAPAATPEVIGVPQAPAQTPEVSGVNPPVSTPEVGDDNSGRGRGRGGDDNSGGDGGGGDDSGGGSDDDD